MSAAPGRPSEPQEPAAAERDTGEQPVRVICGPTAAGKSAVAMALCQRFGAWLLSADSRQVYRGFDIGTAKPTADEQRRVVHRGIDVAEPTARYSAGEWARAATGWLAEAAAGGRPAVVVGGTGFYIRALFHPLFEAPELDPRRRRALEMELGRLTTEELRRWCARLDPARAHLGRAQLHRAVEVALLTGARISDWQRARARPARVSARYLLVDPGAVLAERILARTRAMLEGGWAEEVARLDASVPEDAPAWNATGYTVVREMVRGQQDLATAVERVTRDTRRYARRQRTWFRHQLPAGRVTPLDPTRPEALDLALGWWQERG